MNYYQTLIAVAEDSPVTASVVPVPRGGKKTVAVLQYDMLTEQPGMLTQEDVLFLSWLQRQDGADEMTAPEIAALREEFFSKDQPCLRTSPLAKKYGFGLLFDADGLVRLCPMESQEYRDLVDGTGGDGAGGDGAAGVKILKAMRSSRR